MVQLPRTGEELVNAGSSLFKIADSDESNKGMATLIHQASVRRDVVAALIACLRRLGHRAYRSLDMDAVCAKAQRLSTNGIP